MVVDTYDSLPPEGTLQVVDLGCGRSYLTFALHWLLVEHFRRDVDLVGVDINPSVIEEANTTAGRLSLKGIHFEVCDIASWQPRQFDKVDMVVSLHACDIATDAALAWAVEHKSRVIFAAPCCQHEIAPQLSPREGEALLEHGIIRERLGSLVTDALRSAVLESLGWSCQIMEFIDSAHTPKNLLLRAIIPKVTKTEYELSLHFKAYRELRSFWQIEEFALERYLVTQIERIRLNNTEK
jgi:SAM-dependent methyltransferase